MAANPRVQRASGTRGTARRSASPLVQRRPSAAVRRDGGKFWVPDDADAPAGAVPTTGPEGQPHDERDIQEIAGHTINVQPGTDTTGLADYINAGDHNPDGSG